MLTTNDVCFLQLLCICDYLDIRAAKIELESNVIRSAYPSITTSFGTRPQHVPRDAKSDYSL